MAVEAQGRRCEAKAWLEGLLAGGAVAVKTIQWKARDAGLSWMTVRPAKDALAIVPSKDSYQGGWQWRIEDAQREDAQREDAVSTFEDAQPASVSAFEQTASVAQDVQVSALEELGIANLAARHADFVELANANPPAEGEDLVAWAGRMRRLCDEGNIFLPRPFYARCRATA